MTTDHEFQTLHVTTSEGVATVTIDNPPINLMDRHMMRDLSTVSAQLETDDAVRVVVVESANPEFFIAHADVEFILRLPRDQGAVPSTELHAIDQTFERFRTMPKPTIAKVAGIARGGGSELVLSVDMRFAALETARFGQPEVALGILPGGSGTQRLPRLIGRGRALEVLLGCDDVDARTAEAWGWINRAIPAGELDSFVDDLARRLASFPPAAVAETKASALRAEADPVPGLIAEGDAFSRLLGDPEAIRRMEQFLALGGQTAAIERDLPALYDELASPERGGAKAG